MTVGINIILAVSLNVATGYLGQLPLGHAGFMAVGAYTCALFTKYSNLPSGVAFVVGLVLACIVAGLFGVLIGIPALRLTGDYLAILTLGFGEIIRITLNNIDDVLGFKLFYGAKGLKNIPKYSNYWNVRPSKADGGVMAASGLFPCVSPICRRRFSRNAPKLTRKVAGAGKAAVQRDFRHRLICLRKHLRRVADTQTLHAGKRPFP